MDGINLLRLYEDLGIIPNKDNGLENNKNLLQGQDFMEHRRYNNRNVKHNFIESFENNTVDINKNPTMDIKEKQINLKKNQNLSYSNLSNVKEMNNNKEINLDATTFIPVNDNDINKTVEARKDHSTLRTRSIKFHYIAWLLFAIFILWAIINISISSLSFSSSNLSSEFQPAQDKYNMFSIFIIIVCIVILYYVFSKINTSSIKTVIKVYDTSNAKNDKEK